MAESQLTDQAFSRYSRQIMLTEIGIPGQLALSDAKVLVIGAGGLGSAAALYLAAAGVGLLVIADDDNVERSNLQRQVIYRDQDEQKNKAQAACSQVQALNPLIRTRAVVAKLAGSQLAIEVALADVVLDCSDNLVTRYAVNQACFSAGKPLIAGAAIGWQGQLTAFDFSNQNGPCYQCVFPHHTANEQQGDCRSGGIIGPVVGMMGTMQALAVVKYLTNAGSVGFAELRQFNGLNGSWQTLAMQQDSQCSVCGKGVNTL